jgi:hypothetical protein
LLMFCFLYYTLLYAGIRSGEFLAIIDDSGCHSWVRSFSAAKVGILFSWTFSSMVDRDMNDNS